MGFHRRPRLWRDKVGKRTFFQKGFFPAKSAYCRVSCVSAILCCKNSEQFYNTCFPPIQGNRAEKTSASFFTDAEVGSFKRFYLTKVMNFAMLGSSSIA